MSCDGLLQNDMIDRLSFTSKSPKEGKVEIGMYLLFNELYYRSAQ